MQESAAPVGSTVHVLTWEHGHGTTVTAYSTWEGLVAAKARIARDHWGEVYREHPDELPRMAPTDDAEAAELYFLYCGDEESAHGETLIVEGCPPG